MDEDLSKFAVGLRDRLGARAIPVAQEQERAASGEIALAWREVVQHLQSVTPRGEISRGEGVQKR